MVEDWQGNMITCDFRGNRVNRFAIADSGSGYAAKQLPDPLVSTHRAFRPICVTQGPDGALYIADWYNPIIQHGEVDFRDERRDHVHGRIWRLKPKAGEAPPKPPIAGAPLGDLVALLGEPEMGTRLLAKAELKTREADAASAAISEWLDGFQDGETADYDRMMLEALWAKEAIGKLDLDLLHNVLASPNPDARAAALRVLYHRGKAIPDALAILEKAVGDPHPRVRLGAIHALEQLGSADAVRIAMRVLDADLVDEPIDYSLWHLIRERRAAWMPAFQSGEFAFEKPSHLIFALKSAGGAESAPYLAKALASAGQLDDASRGEAIALLGQFGGPADLDAVLDVALTGPDAARAPAFTALTEAARQRKAKPAGDAGRIIPLIGGEDDATAAAASRLAGLWKLDDARPALVQRFRSNAGSPERLRAAADGLAALGGDLSAKLFDESAAAADLPFRLRALAAIGRAQMDPAAAAPLAAAVLESAPDAGAAMGVLQEYLGRKEGPALLAKALDGKKLPSPVALAAIQKAKTSGGKTEDLVEALKAAGGIHNMGAPLPPEEVEKLAAKVAEWGDPAKGERIYRRKELLCLTCHQIGDGGGLVGPNLVSLGASAPVDYIIDSLLEPTKKIKEGYHTTVFETNAGDVFTGAIARETDTEIIFRDPAGIERPIPKKDIKKKEISPISMMPPGLTASLREDEFVHLVRFLAELGKEGPYKVQPNKFIRTWQVPVPDEKLTDAVRHNGFGAVASGETEVVWAPAFSTVAGELPLDDMPPMYHRENVWRMARFTLDRPSASEVRLHIDNPAGVDLYAGKTKLDIQNGTATANLPAGQSAFTVGYDSKQRGSGLRIEVLE
ncbi:MAG: HEAT repeat domain-containing protein [Verrucomicrobiales bacterium]